MADDNKKTINWLLDNAETVNIAEDVDDDTLKEIGQTVLQGFEDDDASRAEWLSNVEGYIDMAMQVTESKSFPWEDAANIKFPTLSVAALQFHARAYPAIVPSRDVVRGKITGYDPDGEKAKRAERVGKHMTYQLTEEMEEWEDDMDRALLILPIVGCFFKKSYYDPHEARNISKAVWAQDLVIDYDAASFERAPRKSEEFTLYPGEVKERIMAGMWLDTEIKFEDEEKEELETFVEQHTSWDLDGDGYKEPYVVTIQKDTGDVQRISARYDEDAIYYKDGERITSVGDKRREVERKNEAIQQSNLQAGQIAEAAQKATGYHTPPKAIQKLKPPQFDDFTVCKIKPIEYYTRYPFLPAPDGSIYAMGFGQLLGSLSDAADTNINQMLDAGTLSNLGGGFMAKAAKRPSGPQMAGVGEYVSIDTNGMPIRDAVLPFQFRGPSGQSFSLLELLLSAAKDITGIKDISADLAAETTATTAMIIQEESSKVYNSLYKRIFRSMKDELKKLYRLNRKYLPEEGYFRVLDTAEAIKREDYKTDETDVQPVGDPTQASTSQRIIKSQALLQMAGDPDANGYEIKRRYLEAIDIPDIDEVLPPPSNEMSPGMKAELQKIEDDHQKLLAEIGKLHSGIVVDLANAEAKEVGNQLDIYTAKMQTLLGGSNGGDNTGGLPNMAATTSDQGGDEGISGVPAAVESDAGVGPAAG